MEKHFRDGQKNPKKKEDFEYSWVLRENGNEDNKRNVRNKFLKTLGYSELDDDNKELDMSAMKKMVGKKKANIKRYEEISQKIGGFKDEFYFSAELSNKADAVKYFETRFDEELEAAKVAKEAYETKIAEDERVAQDNLDAVRTGLTAKIEKAVKPLVSENINEGISENEGSLYTTNNKTNIEKLNKKYTKELVKDGEYTPAEAKTVIEGCYTSILEEQVKAMKALDEL